MIGKAQLRPYIVIKPFIFNGLQYETGGTFDPQEAGCSAYHLERMISARRLNPTAVVDGEGRRKADKQAEKPVQVEEEAQPTLEQEQASEQVYQEESQVEEEQISTTRTRRRT